MHDRGRPGAAWRWWILPDAWAFGVSLLYFALILFTEVRFWPAHHLPVLNALPVLLAGLSKSPRFTTTIAVLAIVFDVAGIVLKGAPPLTVWPFTLLALIVISYIAILMSLRQQRDQERRRRQEEMIHHVEDLRQPLTVIIAHAQLLHSARERPEHTQSHLDAIERASRDLARDVANLLEHETSR